MSQFSLPKNSKILKGDYYEDKTGSTNIKNINVYRWNPDDGKNCLLYTSPSPRD